MSYLPWAAGAYGTTSSNREMAPGLARTARTSMEHSTLVRDELETGGETSPRTVRWLDFAKYKSPPVWVGANSLFSAMVIVDGTAHATTQRERSDCERQCIRWDHEQIIQSCHSRGLRQFAESINAKEKWGLYYPQEEMRGSEREVEERIWRTAHRMVYD